MHWKRLLPIALLLLVGTMLATAQSKPHRVIFALTSNDDADWQLTLGNIHNLLSGLAPDTVEVELVAYGPGIAFVRKDSSAASGIEALEALHVRFLACENSMRAHHLTAADLLPGVEPVPSGIVEVVTRQESGWSYIKAGR
jgi:intracellular sulfur oxidation DsrE/DsrF family protein